MTNQLLLYVEGRNGSFAQRLNNNDWIVAGIHSLEDQQEPAEYAYEINTDFKTIKKLPADTPIFASTQSFPDFDKEDGETIQTDHYVSTNITEDYETVGDLFRYARETIKDIHDNLADDEIDHFKANNMFSIEALNEVAETIWETRNWTSLSTNADETQQDIQECLNNGEYDAYPELLKEWSYEQWRKEKVSTDPLDQLHHPY